MCMGSVEEMAEAHLPSVDVDRGYPCSHQKGTEYKLLARAKCSCERPSQGQASRNADKATWETGLI
jgi:hypothetical protein